MSNQHVHVHVHLHSIYCEIVNEIGSQLQPHVQVSHKFAQFHSITEEPPDTEGHVEIQNVLMYYR